MAWDLVNMASMLQTAVAWPRPSASPPRWRSINGSTKRITPVSSGIGSISRRWPGPARRFIGAIHRFDAWASWLNPPRSGELCISRSEWKRLRGAGRASARVFHPILRISWLRVWTTPIISLMIHASEILRFRMPGSVAGNCGPPRVFSGPRDAGGGGDVPPIRAGLQIRPHPCSPGRGASSPKYRPTENAARNPTRTTRDVARP